MIEDSSRLVTDRVNKDITDAFGVSNENENTRRVVEFFNTIA